MNSNIATALSKCALEFDQMYSLIAGLPAKTGTSPRNESSVLTPDNVRPTRYRAWLVLN